MRERSYSYSPSPPRGYGRRGRSPSPRGRYRSCGRDLPTSLLIRNLHRDCRREDLRRPFGQFGRLKDIYLPRDYYTGEPRGFGFVQYVDPADASEAKYEMDGQILLGREITVLFAEESRKKPADMRARERFWGRGSDYRSPRYYSRSPRDSRSRSRSRSYYSPPSRQRDYSRGRGYDYKRSPHYYSRSRSRSPSYYSPSPRCRHYSRSVSQEDRRYHGDARSRSPSYYSPSPQRRHYSRSVSPEDRRYHGDARSRSQNPSVSRSPSVEHSTRKRSQRGRSISMGD